MKTHRKLIYGFLFIFVFLVLSSCSFQKHQTIPPPTDGNQTYTKKDTEPSLQEGIRAVSEGDLHRAYALFDAAAAGFAQNKRFGDQCDSLIRQAHVCLSLGQADKAMACLGQAEHLASDMNNQELLGRIYALRGNLNHISGKFEAAEENLQKALSFAKTQRNSSLLISIQNDLGNLYGTTGQYAKAFEAYQDGALLGQKNGNLLHSAIALINGAKVRIANGDQYLAPRNVHRLAAELEDKTSFDPGLPIERQASKKEKSIATTRASILMRDKVETERHIADQGKAIALFAEADSMLGKARTTLKDVDNSQHKTTAHINIGLSFMDLAERCPERRVKNRTRAAWELSRAVEYAREYQDPRLLSYAIGHLGRLRRQEGKFPQAGELTNEAIYWARKADAPESLFRWEWQYALTLTDQNRLQDSITAYRQAIATLESIRAEFTNCYGQSRANLRRTENELYLGYVDVLLRYVPGSDPAERQNILKAARQAVEKRKVFELREYFNDDCLGTMEMGVTNIDEIPGEAVVLYPILLPDRLEIIASFPSGAIRGVDFKDENHPKTITLHYVTDVTSEDVIKEANAFRDALKIKTSKSYLKHSQKLYDWLIRPLEKDLIQSKPNTLVFVPDGALRNIPMSALYNGSSFLIQSYAVAITPGLALTNPTPLSPEKINVLGVGLTSSTQGFEALPGVANELQSISSLHKTTVLVDEQFSLSNFEKALKNDLYNVVHIASHGKFSENVEDSFILAADEQLTFNDLSKFVGLYRFREQPLELLTLSACETAAGNEQAALGLAGIAVKIGARSVLATLWSVDDQAAAQLISEFYRQLRQPGVSRAMALQKAKLKLLNDPVYEHPGYWSPFILINNWL